MKNDQHVNNTLTCGCTPLQHNTHTTHSEKSHLSGGVPASWPGVQDGLQHVFVDGVGTNGGSSKQQLQTFQHPAHHRWLFDSFYCLAYRCETKQQPQKSIQVSSFNTNMVHK
jgi:hypothetical protein